MNVVSCAHLSQYKICAIVLYCSHLLPLRGIRFIRIRALRIFALWPVDMNRRSFLSLAPRSRPGLLMNGGTMVTRSEADNLWRGSFCSLAICSFFRLCPGELSGVMSISLNAGNRNGGQLWIREWERFILPVGTKFRQIIWGNIQ